MMHLVGHPAAEIDIDKVWRSVVGDACESGKRLESVACRTLKFEAQGMTVVNTLDTI